MYLSFAFWFDNKLHSAILELSDEPACKFGYDNYFYLLSTKFEYDGQIEIMSGSVKGKQTICFSKYKNLIKTFDDIQLATRYAVEGIFNE